MGNSCPYSNTRGIVRHHSPTEEWLARLLSYPSISAAGNLDLIAEIKSAFKDAACWQFPDDTGQKSALLLRIGPDVAGGLMLSGHLDVVPVTGQNWTYPPFEATFDGGRIYGRGSADMKGFVAASLAAALAAAPLDRPLWLALSYDEEIGCVGVRPMLAAMAQMGLSPDLIIVGEPPQMQIGLGHKGKVAFSATATGVSGHSAEAPLALNALHILADFMAALRGMQDDLAAQSDGPYTIPYPTVHVGRINGGGAVNLVPNTAEMGFELRFDARFDAGGDALLARIYDMAAQVIAPYRAKFPDAALVLTQTNAYPAFAIDPTRLSDFAAIWPHPTCHLSYGTEAGLFAQSLPAPVVICGPGNMAQGHREDEYIETAQLAACDDMLRRAIQQFCKNSQRT
jgi:acetylornithine deacetylase